MLPGVEVAGIAVWQLAVGASTSTLELESEGTADEAKEQTKLNRSSYWLLGENELKMKKLNRRW